MSFFGKWFRILWLCRVTRDMPQSLEPPYADFLRLYAQHEAALHVFVRAMLSNRQEADEVMQQVVVVLWSKFDQAQDFKKWAFGVARLEVLRFLQARKRDRHVFDEALMHRLADRAALHAPEVASRREALDGCLEKLPAAQRELVLTAYTKGTRMDELATHRGQTPMALYKLLQRIRQALLDCVERTLAEEATA
jgi:RNA polymerase sigma-70 factor (ECF subfamily)